MSAGSRADAPAARTSAAEGVSASAPLREGRIGICFLGCGAAARMHGRTLARVDRSLRRFYASRTAARAEAFCADVGGEGSFASYDAALGSPEVDVAVVTTPPSTHLELTRRALRAEKHVIVEKPPFLSASDFDEVADLAARKGRQLMVAENYFYKPLTRRLRTLLEEGVVGRPLFLVFNALKRQRTGDWRDEPGLAGGGALFEGGIHWINLAASLGPAVRRVEALRPVQAAGPERSMQVCLEYEGGGAGVLLYSWEVPSPLQGLRMSRIYGTEGSIGFESNGLFVAVWGRKKRLFFPGFRDISGYRAMFADFLGALREGRDPEFTLRMARRDLEILEAAYRSAEVSASGRRP